MASVQDVKGKRVAFGDVNSASSFTFQIAMLMDAGLDPVRDLSAIRMTGSHASSLAALTQGQVDVASLSFDSYEKAVQQGAVDPKHDQGDRQEHPDPLSRRSRCNAKLPEALKAKLKDCLRQVHKAPGVTPEMIRGYGGKKVDRFDTNFSESRIQRGGREAGAAHRRAQGPDPEEGGRALNAPMLGLRFHRHALSGRHRGPGQRIAAVPAGQFCVVLGASGAGQVHAAAHGQRAGDADRRRRLVTACASAPASLARIQPRIGMIHQQFNLVLRSSVATNVLCGALPVAAALARVGGPVSRSDAPQGLRTDRGGGPR